MDYKNPTSGETPECLNLDIFSTLPQSITESILSLMPIRDALRTSVLSKNWQYYWRSMPNLTFTNDMVKLTYDSDKYKLVSAIFHVLLLHNGPEILVFDCSVGELQMESEFAQIISYLARGNRMKQLIIAKDKSFYKLPVSFFSLQGLERIQLENCVLEPPLAFKGFRSLKDMTLINVEVSTQMLQLFLSKCPQLKSICFDGYEEGVDFVTGENKFTYIDLLQCLPLIKTLDVSKYYTKYFCADSMPRKLPTSLHLINLFMDVCLMERNEISSALCLIGSSPMLKEIIFQMYDNDKFGAQQTPTNFLDIEGYPDLKLDHLEILVIEMFSNLPLEMEFVKLIMAKSPALTKARIELNDNVSVDEEVKILKAMLLLPLPRASPSAKLTIVRPNTS